ncbi:MAG: hypothetical protein HYZ87_04435 [Candidatus Omnitrophica bacterium]|nr:hypothetical protein [Candidatus Omnitrophota bacterium]
MGLFKKEKHEGRTAGLVIDQDNSVSGQLKKISEHLVFLEKKVDMLLNQSRQQRPFSGSGYNQGNYSRPRSAYGHGQPNRGGFGRPQQGSGRGHYGHSSHSGPSHSGHFQKKFVSPQSASQG